MLPILNTLIKRIWIVLMLIGLISLNACKDSDKNSSLIFEELNESLERSNEIANSVTQEAMHELKNKMADATTAYRAQIWMPKAEFIHFRTTQFIQFFDSLKSALNKATEFKTGKNNLEQAKDNKVVNKLFIKQGGGKELYERLKAYRKQVLNTDEQIMKEFKDKLTICNSKFQSEYNNEKEFLEKVFTGTSTLKALTSLLKYENDIYITESNLVTYCRFQVPSSENFYTKFSVLTGQNSKHFKSGDELVIQSGIGSYSQSSKPSFLINGFPIQPNENGIGIYKMKVENKLGKYKVPVKVIFTTQDGKTESFSDFVEYTVDK